MTEGNVASHTARSTAFEQPQPGSLPASVRIKVDGNKLRTVLGTVAVHQRISFGIPWP
jgi:3',5'-cyclic-AMP phosphodiesterase